MTSPNRDTGPNALRRGRSSVPRASYFLTICTVPRGHVLTGPIAEAILRECNAMDADQIWHVRCSTVMPDHVHLFITLGERLILSQAVARLKVATREQLAPRGATWQQNYYDHKLRPSDSIEAILRYVWLNPFSAGLITTGETWPYFHCAADDWAWFSPTTNGGAPFPEWLR